MTEFYPQKAANDITKVLRAAGVAELPVDIKAVAMEISQQKYLDDPISRMREANISGFEGSLIPDPAGKKGWGILYNNAVTSRGRVNFTLGHEFGHYLLHRKAYPKGFQCSTEDMASWESEHAQRENEANIFAATLLMPLDDFRAQIKAKDHPGFDQLGYCADRYEVSLMAATLRWLQYTSRRSMLVVSSDGFIHWARASKPAFQAGIYYKTHGRPPIEVPLQSLAANAEKLAGPNHQADHSSSVWQSRSCTEHLIVSDQYDFRMSLLHFEDADPRFDDQEEAMEDTATRIRDRNPGQSWLS